MGATSMTRFRRRRLRVDLMLYVLVIIIVAFATAAEPAWTVRRYMQWPCPF